MSRHIVRMHIPFGSRTYLVEQFDQRAKLPVQLPNGRVVTIREWARVPNTNDWIATDVIEELMHKAVQISPPIEETLGRVHANGSVTLGSFLIADSEEEAMRFGVPVSEFYDADGQLRTHRLSHSKQNHTTHPPSIGPEDFVEDSPDDESQLLQPIPIGSDTLPCELAEDASDQLPTPPQPSPTWWDSLVECTRAWLPFM